jgi:hypothetical protein
MTLSLVPTRTKKKMELLSCTQIYYTARRALVHFVIFCRGNFADALGDDFLGLRELGIADEFGMSSLTVPKKLLKGKNKGESKLSASACVLCITGSIAVVLTCFILSRIVCNQRNLH